MAQKAKMPKLIDMDQNQLISWINTLDFSDVNKTKIINGIKQCAEDLSDPVTGKDFYEAGIPDIQELTSEAIGTHLAKKLSIQINKKKDQDVGDRIPNPASSDNNNSNIDNHNNKGTFTLNLLADQGKSVKIENVTKFWKVSDIKAQYLTTQGNHVAADKYRDLRTAKWNSEEGRVNLYKSGKAMDDNKTLEDYKITCQSDCNMPLWISFKCRGGAEAKHAEDDVDTDQYRVRKLRRKKHKGTIKLSTKPDCIMGYTDADNIRRAEMPCGCAIASDTMWRYMKALFEKNFKGTQLFCPMPKNLCGGTDQQREWPWNLIFIIADLSSQEIADYSRIITNRTAGTKNCPHCGAMTERPKELRICRVACNQCSGSDWCWNCTNVWKSGGLGPICGNKECMGAEINNILKDCDWVVPKRWLSDGEIHESSLTCPGNEGKVPKVRACPECCSIIEYVDECKHMWCLCCPHEFCFNCLGAWEKDGGCRHSNICNLYKSNDGKYHQVFT